MWASQLEFQRQFKFYHDVGRTLQNPCRSVSVHRFCHILTTNEESNATNATLDRIQQELGSASPRLWRTIARVATDQLPRIVPDDTYTFSEDAPHKLGYVCPHVPCIRQRKGLLHPCGCISIRVHRKKVSRKDMTWFTSDGSTCQQVFMQCIHALVGSSSMSPSSNIPPLSFSPMCPPTSPEHDLFGDILHMPSLDDIDVQRLNDSNTDGGDSTQNSPIPDMIHRLVHDLGELDIRDDTPIPDSPLEISRMVSELVRDDSDEEEEIYSPHEIRLGEEEECDHVSDICDTDIYHSSDLEMMSLVNGEDSVFEGIGEVVLEDFGSIAAAGDEDDNSVGSLKGLLQEGLIDEGLGSDLLDGMSSTQSSVTGCVVEQPPLWWNVSPNAADSIRWVAPGLVRRIATGDYEVSDDNYDDQVLVPMFDIYVALLRAREPVTFNLVYDAELSRRFNRTRRNANEKYKITRLWERALANGVVPPDSVLRLSATKIASRVVHLLMATESASIKRILGDSMEHVVQSTETEVHKLLASDEKKTIATYFLVAFSIIRFAEHKNSFKNIRRDLLPKLAKSLYVESSFIRHAYQLFSNM